MNARTRDFVRRRAGNRCEYCLLRQEHGELIHHVEHIIAKQLVAPTIPKIWLWHATVVIFGKVRT
jgi:hypothetical protein